MKFELEIEEVNVILQGLGELPAKHSMGLIQKIQQQAAPQMQPEMVSEEGAEQPLFYCGQIGTALPDDPTPIIPFPALTQLTPGTQI